MIWLVHSPLHFRTAEAQYGTEEKLGYLSALGERVEILDQFFHHALVLQFMPSLVRVCGGFNRRNEHRCPQRYCNPIHINVLSHMTERRDEKKSHQASNALLGVE